VRRGRVRSALKGGATQEELRRASAQGSWALREQVAAPVSLIAAFLALLPAVAEAAFPGRNGAIVYGYDDGGSTWDDQLGDASVTVTRPSWVRGS
jgi:hypothetical protein